MFVRSVAIFTYMDLVLDERGDPIKSRFFMFFYAQVVLLIFKNFKKNESIMLKVST